MKETKIKVDGKNVRVAVAITSNIVSSESEIPDHFAFWVYCYLHNGTDRIDLDGNVLKDAKGKAVILKVANEDEALTEAIEKVTEYLRSKG